MTATASRNSSFTPRYAGGTEQYVKDTVQDVIFNANVYLWLLKQKNRIQVGQFGAQHVVNMRQNKGAAAVTGRHLDPVTFSVPDGPQSALFEYGEYRKGIVYSKSEQADNVGQQQMVDLVQERIDAEVLTFVEQINYDLIHGNSSDSLKMLGLMQAIYPKDHITVNPDLATRVQMRQANNTYAGIARVASAGTGWENCSLNLDASDASSWTDETDNVFKFGTNQAPSGAYKAFTNLFSLGCTYGKVRPNCVISTGRPWMDYQHMVNQTVRYTGDNRDGADLGIPYIMHLGAMWGVEDQLAQLGTVGDADATGGDIIMVLNTDFWHLKVQEGFYFDTSRDWQQFPDQVADGTILLFRGFHECHNPRYQGCLFNYGAA